MTIEKVREDGFIGECQVADLLFLCGEYKKHNLMYDQTKYWPDVSWLAPYFYGSKCLGETEGSEKLLSGIIDEINKEIAETEIDDEYTSAEREELTHLLSDRRDGIVEIYNKIMNDEYKPEVEIKLWCIFTCYLLDCPRHQKIS